MLQSLYQNNPAIKPRQRPNEIYIYFLKKIINHTELTRNLENPQTKTIPNTFERNKRIFHSMWKPAVPKVSSMPHDFELDDAGIQKFLRRVVGLKNYGLKFQG